MIKTAIAFTLYCGAVALMLAALYVSDRHGFRKEWAYFKLTVLDKYDPADAHLLL